MTMQSNPETKKAPAATGAIKNRKTNNQKEETMFSSLPRIPSQFDAKIKVSGLTGNIGTLSGGGLPDVQVVTLRTHDELLSFTPREALALAAMLESLAVHVLEEADGQVA